MKPQKKPKSLNEFYLWTFALVGKDIGAVRRKCCCNFLVTRLQLHSTITNNHFLKRCGWTFLGASLLGFNVAVISWDGQGLIVFLVSALPIWVLFMKCFGGI